ncbi:MAG TPA: carboxypeptidase-like regulatory domain-containing protein [Myxococcales bacterium]
MVRAASRRKDPRIRTDDRASGPPANPDQGIKMTFGVRQMLALCVALVAGCGGDPGTSVTKPPGAESAPGADTPAGANPPPAPPKPAGSMHFSGTVRSQRGIQWVPDTIYRAEVKATIDRNHDGSISEDETYRAFTDADGGYSLDVPVDPGDLVVLRFWDLNNTPVLRTVKAAPKGNMVLNARLGALGYVQEPECLGTVCPLNDGSFALNGLPPETRIVGLVFNPIKESYALPDNSRDSAGNFLESAVFAAFTIEDDMGFPVDKFAVPAEMRLLIPRDTWGIMRDVAGGNDRIDVPLYWFDEVKAWWVRDPNPAHLEDGDGHVIAPSSLAAIRDGSFSGVVYAVGNVNHFSTWSVAWPIPSSGCVSGRVLDETGKPAEGAVVTLQGVSYTGASTMEVLGPDGRFCLEARRSEAPGEDLDGNGKSGEKTTVLIRVATGEDLHELGAFEMPIAAGACGGAGCGDVGDLRLTQTTLLKTDWCTINGTVTFPEGDPEAGSAALSDDNVRPDVLASMCKTGLDWSCTTDFVDFKTGFFSVTAPVVGELKFTADLTRELEPGADETGIAARNFTSCPTEPLALTAVPHHISLDFAIAVDGNAISWTPARYGITLVTVRSGADMKWQIYSKNGAVMHTPVTYGVLPPGAIQIYPPVGSPAPLATGSTVEIESTGPTIDGVPYFGNGLKTL